MLASARATAGWVALRRAGCSAVLGLAASLGAPAKAEPAAAPPAAAPAASAPAPAAAPAPVIDRFHAALLESMQAGAKQSYAEREKRLAPIVAETYDLAFMSRAALGRHWRTLSQEEGQRVIQGFTRMTIANYASQFASFGGERFETGETVDGGQGTQVVRSKIIESDGKATSLDYRMRSTPEGWRVIDVFLDGSVSQLALHRADYSGVFERDGLSGLLAALDDKVKKLASGEISSRRH